MTETAPKPCPFCGAMPQDVYETGKTMRCPTEGCIMAGFLTPVSTWNRRPNPETQAVAIREIAAAQYAYAHHNWDWQAVVIGISDDAHLAFMKDFPTRSPVESVPVAEIKKLIQDLEDHKIVHASDCADRISAVIRGTK